MYLTPWVGCWARTCLDVQKTQQGCHCFQESSAGSSGDKFGKALRSAGRGLSIWDNGFLRKAAVSCGFLRKSVPWKCCKFLENRKSAKIRKQKTMLLVNHSFARVTPAIFVISSFSRGLSSKALVFLVRT